MKRKLQLLQIAATLGLVLSLVLAGVAYAITITVDGSREAAWNGSGGQTPGSVGDPNEASINDNVDIQTFQWTNNTSDFYFLIKVWAAAPLMPALAPIDICLDTTPGTDIPVTNGIQRDRCSYSTGVSGIDTVVEAYRLSNGTKLVDVYDVTTDPPTWLGSGTLGYNPAATNPVVEIGVPLSLLGFGPGVCPASIPTVVYYDGGDTNPDDNLPDAGSINIGCGAPTAVTLESASARSGANAAIPFAVAAVLLMVGAGMLVVLRRKQA
jgi:hypothetical protein